MEEVSGIQAHYRKIRNILIWILVLNWAVALAKIIFGWISNFSSMTADGFHSLSDGTSNIIGLIGIRFASLPVDKDHPYGHRKYETFFSLTIAMLLAIVAFSLFKEGLARLKAPGISKIETASFAVMLITLAVNFFVMRYEYNRGKFLKSDFLVSDSLHTKADIFTSLSVICALIVTKMGYPIIDPIMTMFISLFIAYSAFGILKHSSKVLCDTAVIMDDKKIEDIVLSVKGAKNCHKIRTRGREDDIHIDLHVQVSPHMHMDEAHKISYAIEEALKKGIQGVTDVVVHMEPRE
jgi:cation diffusion facilitator family transporter